MAEPPVMFKRTKSKPSQRGRVPTTDAAPAVEEGEPEESPSALAVKLKKKTRAKAKSALSFGGDEEEGDGEVFQLKKSSLSKKLKLGKAAPGVNLETTITPKSTGPTYDAAYLSQLKANTPSARFPLPAGDSYDADISMDVDSPAQLSALSNIADEETETAIPSASSVLAAKQKRERLRASKPGEDYISLSLTKRSDYSQGPHPDSRLVREEDELGDADDEYAEYTSAQERIALGKKSRKKEAQKRREEMNEMIVDAYAICTLIREQ
ncbi:nineteen complex-related protein 2-domain-containing protein [Fomes fomentarius]|nr:nineteen complex-related protein 2-domain-containing protein [Fomes fomentarius]